jgi:hypothetical protein
MKWLELRVLGKLYTTNKKGERFDARPSSFKDIRWPSVLIIAQEAASVEADSVLLSLFEDSLEDSCPEHEGAVLDPGFFPA